MNPTRSNVHRFDGAGMSPPIIGSPEPYDEHLPLVAGGQGRTDEDVARDGMVAAVWAFAAVVVVAVFLVVLAVRGAA